MRLWQVLQIRAPEGRERKERVFRYVAIGADAEAAIAAVRADNDIPRRPAKWEAYALGGDWFMVGVYFRDIKKEK